MQFSQKTSKKNQSITEITDDHLCTGNFSVSLANQHDVGLNVRRGL